MRGFPRQTSNAWIAVGESNYWFRVYDAGEWVLCAASCLYGRSLWLCPVLGRKWSGCELHKLCWPDAAHSLFLSHHRNREYVWESEHLSIDRRSSASQRCRHKLSIDGPHHSDAILCFDDATWLKESGDQSFSYQVPTWARCWPTRNLLTDKQKQFPTGSDSQLCWQSYRHSAINKTDPLPYRCF